MKIVDVAAAILTRPDGSFLLGQRAPDTFYPGYWEFPGGKLEPGESPAQALARELYEELGIETGPACPWVTREHVYEHAHVRLHFFEIQAWRGEIRDHVHSALAWQRWDRLEVGPLLPAAVPLMRLLGLPRWYAVTHAGDVGIDAQLERLDAALAAGLRMVQVREPGLSPAAREAFARAALDRVRARGGLLLVNDDLALAAAIGADGVQLPARQVRALAARPDFPWVGASCHDLAEREAAVRLGADFLVLGSVQPTPSHPGRPALGWEGFAGLAVDSPLPVFALGGLGPGDLPRARLAGAHGIAAIRGSWA